LGDPVTGSRRDCENAIHSRCQFDDPVTWVHQENAEDPAERIEYRTNSIKTLSGERKMKNKHIGSNFDDFLQEEGLLAEADATALKRLLVFQIEKEMEERNLTKTSFAGQMRTSRSSLDRLLDPENPSVTLLTLEKVASALGRQLKVEFA
jgi:hypothetical protein